MAQASGMPRPGWARIVGRPDGLVAAVALAFALGTAIRFGIGHDRPFWIDETFTGAIAAEPDAAGLLRQVEADVNAPLYYVAMFLWSSVAGISNAALRFPSAVFGTAACLLIFRGGSGIDQRVALLWGALVGLWIPGLLQGGEARAYALLLLTSTAATLAFAGLLAGPSRSRACAWGGCAALSVLTHYFAAPLVAAQAAILLGYRWRRAPSLWPAALAFVPALAWMAFHAPRLAEFARPDIAWYEVIGLADLPAVWGYVLNGAGAIVPLAVAVAAARRSGTALPKPGREGPASDGRIMLAVVAASLIGALTIVAAGMVRPSFVPRYLVPFVPGLLLGVAVAAQAAGRRRAYAPFLALALFALPLLRLAEPRGPAFEFQGASAAVAASGAKRLVFLWDHPASPVQDPAQMRAVGGFFLARAGRPVAVIAVANPWQDDPAPRLLQAAGSDPDTAILWLYDRSLRKTAAVAHPPHISSDPAWACADHGVAPFGALVCTRRAPGVTPAG